MNNTYNKEAILKVPLLAHKTWHLENRPQNTHTKRRKSEHSSRDYYKRDKWYEV